MRSQSAKRWLFVLCLVLATCAGCAAPKPTYKIALVGPFEGRLRQIGYDAFPAMRIALRDQINAGGIGNAFVTFVAYNDNGDPAAAERVARNVALDPEVLGVIGHLVPSTTLSALRVYTEAGLPVLALGVPADLLPEDPLVFRMGPTEKSEKVEVRSETCNPAYFSLQTSYFGDCVSDAPPLSELPQAQLALATFADISLGPPPTPRSIVAFDATNVLLQAVSGAARRDGRPMRAGVAESLRTLQHDGLLGQIWFDEQGKWPGARLWVHPK
jgi:ABC-type branched-subunit amino acid transport system substrate-binding protein